MSLKSLVLDALAQALFMTKVSDPARRGRGKLLVLTFHRVLPHELRQQYPLPGLAVTPEELDWILRQLVPHFRVLAMSEAVRALRAENLAKPLLSVTFDDGQWDNLAYAEPVLRNLGVKATFYVPTDFVGTERLLWHDAAAFAWQAIRRDPAKARQAALSFGIDCNAGVGAFLDKLKSFDPKRRLAAVASVYGAVGFKPPEWARLMTWDEIVQLHRSGHEIGSHGCTHTLLPQLDADGQRAELEQSMRAIQNALHAPVPSVCYPNGSYDERTLRAAAELGYENAVTTAWGINTRQSGIYELRRCDMDARRLRSSLGKLSRARLAIRLSGLQPGLA